MATAPIEERDVTARAQEVVRRCRELAQFSEEAGATTRTFLATPMRDVHTRVTDWMTRAGMSVSVDHAGNIRGLCPALSAPASSTSDTVPCLFVGSHLDTVPNAGAFDGVLGVVTAIALVELLGSRRFPFNIEVVGFSEEEGVRFGVPFIGSRALAGSVDEALLARRDSRGRSVADAIRDYGLDPNRIVEARASGDAVGFLEFHVEQGPVLDTMGRSLGIVTNIVGVSRHVVVFEGAAGHAGTTPMDARRDALAGSAEWISAVERETQVTPGLVATVGRLEVEPGAINVIAGRCRASLDVRHADDAVRASAVARLETASRAIASRRRLGVEWLAQLDQPAVAMDVKLTALLGRGFERTGIPVHRMASGAGHDAMIMASRMPSAMLFLRSPGGVSHHPDEAVREEDVAAALAVGRVWLDEIAGSRSWSM